MIKSRRFTKNLTIYLLVYIICTNSYANSQDDEPEEEETTTTEIPPEAPEPVEENYDLCDLPYLGGEEPKPVPENLMRMGPNSKYFILVGVDSIPIKEVAEFCETIGLQPAEIRHNIELASIELFLKENAPEDTVISLGINDEVDEGNFVEFDGTPMKFHSFAERQPNNRMNAESCITVAPHPFLERLVYNDVTCDTGVTPMCMFPPSSQCYLGSPLSLARVKDGFDLVGSTNKRDYFVAFRQYPRKEAADMCQKAGYTLVDFDTGLSNNQIVYDLTKKWLIRNYIFQAIPFWTGGKVTAIDTVNPDVGEAGTPQYKFESSGKMLSDLTQWPSLAWDNEEPSDASGLGLEQCISAILYEPYQSSGDNIFSLSTTNCRLPHYPLCYQEKFVEPVNVTVEETECNDTETEGQMGRALTLEDLKPGRFCTIGDVKVNLSAPQLTVEELLSIAAATRHKPLASDEYRITWALEKNWLSNFTDIIFKVPREFCPLSYLPPAYMNVMHNLLILYYNSILNKLRDPAARDQRFLADQTEIFAKCAKKLRPATFESAGGLPTVYKGYSIEPIEELVEHEENAGKKYIPDMIIDSFWYFFQITVASCWGEAKQPGDFPSRTYNLQRIHHIFTTHFLKVFEERWFSALTEVDYGVIVGDIDIDQAYYTMKSCAIAAFINSNITELYFPRPVYIPGMTSERINEKYQDLKMFVLYNNKEEDE